MKQVVFAKLTNNRLFLGVIEKMGQSPIGVMYRADGYMTWNRLKFRNDIKSMCILGYVKKYNKKSLTSMMKNIVESGLYVCMNQNYKDKWECFPFYFQNNSGPLAFANKLSSILNMRFKILNWNPFTIKYYDIHHQVILIFGRRHVIVNYNGHKHKVKRSYLASSKYRHFTSNWNKFINQIKCMISN